MLERLERVAEPRDRVPLLADRVGEQPAQLELPAHRAHERVARRVRLVEARRDVEAQALREHGEPLRERVDDLLRRADVGERRARDRDVHAARAASRARVRASRDASSSSSSSCESEASTAAADDLDVGVAPPPPPPGVFGVFGAPKDRRLGLALANPTCPASGSRRRCRRRVPSPPPAE